MWIHKGRTFFFVIMKEEAGKDEPVDFKCLLCICVVSVSISLYMGHVIPSG